MTNREHLPCPCGKSSDAYTEYDDGGYCFSCSRAFGGTSKGEGHKKNKDKDREDQRISLTDHRLYDILKVYTIGKIPKVPVPKEQDKDINKNINKDIVPKVQDKDINKNINKDIVPKVQDKDRVIKIETMYRKLTNKTLDFYKIKIENNKVLYPYPKFTKVRNLDKKEFYTLGDSKGSAGLFGKDLFPAGGKMITITEGENDAAAVYQMNGGYPSVSVRSSSQAVADCKADYDYLNSFERIYLCFDNDEPGQNALRLVAILFNPNKVYEVKLNRFKDAHEYLENYAEKDFVREWWASKPYLPSGIVGDYASIEEILDQESSVAVATYPYDKLQSMTYGIRLGEVVLITAQEKVGKQLSLDTKLPTPNGWTTVGELKIGDELIGVDGAPVKVTYITDVQHRPMYRVKFSDKTYLDAGDEHQWTVRNLNGKISTETTQNLVDKGVIQGNSKAQWMVPMMRPLDLPDIELTIDPYLLGVWLADGHSYSANICLSPSKRERLNGYTETNKREEKGDCASYRFAELTHDTLLTNNLIKNKHIPAQYLRASIKQRKLLLKGLMFDGWKEKEYYSSHKILFDQVVELLRSLGYLVNTRIRGDKHWSARFSKRKWKAIRSIEKIETVPSKCLTVDHPQHLFAAGDGWTMTHNTEVIRSIEYHLLKTTDYNLGIIHLEEPEKRTVQGLVGYELHKPVHLPDSFVSNKESLQVFKDITQRDNRCFLYKHFGSDDPKVILDTIRYLVAVCDCKFIFLDHITMLVTGYQDDNERKVLDFLSTQLAMLTRELNFTLFLVSHVNDDGKTRGSRNISKIADLIIHLDRDIEASSLDIRNKTNLLVKGNRWAGMSGPSSNLWFDQGTFMYSEIKNDKEDQSSGASKSFDQDTGVDPSNNNRSETLWVETSREKANGEQIEPLSYDSRLLQADTSGST